jgi:hypothetical protein
MDRGLDVAASPAPGLLLIERTGGDLLGLAPFNRTPFLRLGGRRLYLPVNSLSRWSATASFVLAALRLAGLGATIAYAC